MSIEEILKQIKHFIIEGPAAGDLDFSNEDNLFEEGIIDSMGLLDVVEFVEANFGIVVDDAAVDIDTFGSLNAIAAYVEQARLEAVAQSTPDA